MNWSCGTSVAKRVGYMARFSDEVWSPSRSSVSGPGWFGDRGGWGGQGDVCVCVSMWRGRICTSSREYIWWMGANVNKRETNMCENKCFWFLCIFGPMWRSERTRGQPKAEWAAAAKDEGTCVLLRSCDAAGRDAADGIIGRASRSDPVYRLRGWFGCCRGEHSVYVSVLLADCAKLCLLNVLSNIIRTNQTIRAVYNRISLSSHTNILSLYYWESAQCFCR